MLYLDHPEHASGFQDPASGWLVAIIDLHDRIVFYLLLILLVVLWGFLSALLNGAADRPLGQMSFLGHGNLLEMFWTATPALILWAIGLPSLRLLYLMDELLDPEMTAKVTGSQWFWSFDRYGSTGQPIERFDSFMKGAADLEPGELRVLAVDNFLTLPAGAAIRLLVTSADVIHSFAMPALALKVDAIPGRLNLAGLIIARPGTFYGQCSELCGVLHGFMPIGLLALGLPQFAAIVGGNDDHRAADRAPRAARDRRHDRRLRGVSAHARAGHRRHGEEAEVGGHPEEPGRPPGRAS